MLNRYTNATSYNTFRRHVNALINEAVNLGMDERDLLKNKSKKAKAKLYNITIGWNPISFNVVKGSIR